MNSRGTDIDALFRLPLSEFTAARNALVAKLKKSAKPEEAEHVRVLQKPSVSAWAINQLYWSDPKSFERLISVGERFRQAQAAQLAGRQANISETLEARHEVVSQLLQRVTGVLNDAKHPSSPDMMRRVTGTLEALAAFGTHPEAPRAGRLTSDLDPPGFEALAALAAPTGRGAKPDGATRVLPFRQPDKKSPGGRRTAEQREAERLERLAAANNAIREADGRLRTARKAAERAEAALKNAAARAKETEKAKASVEAQFEKVSAEAEHAKAEARRMAAQAEEAVQATEEAERALAKARAERDALSST
jgi:hypothetical protein